VSRFSQPIPSRVPSRNSAPPPKPTAEAGLACPGRTRLHAASDCDLPIVDIERAGKRAAPPVVTAQCGGKQARSRREVVGKGLNRIFDKQALILPFDLSGLVARHRPADEAVSKMSK